MTSLNKEENMMGAKEKTNTLKDYQALDLSMLKERITKPTLAEPRM
jgi:hypothetical protein